MTTTYEEPADSDSKGEQVTLSALIERSRQAQRQRREQLLTRLLLRRAQDHQQPREGGD